MANIFEVVQKFLNEPNKIQEVFRAEKEFYFRYASHCFSLIKRTQDIQKFGDLTLYVYPDWNQPLISLHELFTSGDGSNEPKMIAYHVKEYPEIREPLTRLYKLLEQKNLNIDQLFDDILNS